MRISDWSSDVCSSDLGGSRGGASVTGILRLGGGVILVDPAGLVDELPDHSHQIDRSLRLDDLVAVFQHHRIATRQQRSEEHTSELQSLMRTSYAVFCLKKKNY